MWFIKLQLKLLAWIKAREERQTRKVFAKLMNEPDGEKILRKALAERGYPTK
jgi:hypothetical protein